MILKDGGKYFTRKLICWNNIDNQRKMPWKAEKNPYRIWLSEIILQQTRVEQGLAYYNNFIQTFPTIRDLSEAPEEKIFKMWEGLGYYTRCKNLIITAKFITQELGGIFPRTYEAILDLQGIGPYTASAIASFAFNLPYAVVDGNVYRVLARFFGIAEPVDNKQGKKTFEDLAYQILDKKHPGNYNQAIMDFGATICKPRLPECGICPLKTKCVAFKTGRIGELPVKEKKLIRKDRWLYYLVIEYKGKYYVNKRTAKDIWQNLHEFPLIEVEGMAYIGDLESRQEFQEIFDGHIYNIIKISDLLRQQLTHQNIYGQFIEISVKKPITAFKNYNLVSSKAMDSLAFPKFIARYLKDKNVSLNLL